MTDEDSNDFNWELTIADYQERASETAIYPSSFKGIYPFLGLISEIGEYAGKLKKQMRDGTEFTTEDRAKELGDALWYFAALCSDNKLDMAYVANGNLQKLADRKERGVLGGSGDNR